jgi:pimeloyl-ACP methyl ester carboxylesterase
MPTIRRQDAVIEYATEGEGTPVVFVNSWATSKFCWMPAVARLARRHRCVAYDPRGVGDSLASGEASFEVEDHVQDLAAVCEELELYDAHVVGHELGGRVATLFARSYPQFVSTLTIVGWWGPAEISEAVGGVTKFRQAASLLLRDLGVFPVLRNLVSWGYRRAPEPYRTRLFDEFASVDARAAYLTAVAAADPRAATEFERAASRLAIPVLLVQGEEDRDAARAGLRSLFERLPHVDLATVHGAGALPMLEFPDAFARTLEAFIAEHDPR